MIFHAQTILATATVCFAVGQVAAAGTSSVEQAAAEDTYYLPPMPQGPFAQLLYDQPETLALARCYGRYDSVLRAGDRLRAKPGGPAEVFHAPSDLGAIMAQLGATLVAVAARDRNQTIALNQLVPESIDELNGVWIPTGAPDDIYAAYDSGSAEIMWGSEKTFFEMAPQRRAEVFEKALPGLLGSCRRLEADVNARRNPGRAAEPIFRDPDAPKIDGQPIALALAFCYGLQKAFRMDFEREGYPDGFFHDWRHIETALAATARRDRGEALKLEVYPDDPALPPALAEAYEVGTNSENSGRPDFLMIVDPSYVYGTRPLCDRVLKEAATSRQ